VQQELAYCQAAQARNPNLSKGTVSSGACGREALGFGAEQKTDTSFTILLPHFVTRGGGHLAKSFSGFICT